MHTPKRLSLPAEKSFQRAQFSEPSGTKPVASKRFKLTPARQPRTRAGDDETTTRAAEGQSTPDTGETSPAASADDFAPLSDDDTASAAAAEQPRQFTATDCE